MSQDGEMTVREAGRRGGAKRLAQLGLEGYAAMGRVGGATTKARHGTEHYAEMGRKGGEANLRNKGVEHFRKMGRKGGARVKALIEAGRKVQEEEDRLGK